MKKEEVKETISYKMQGENLIRTVVEEGPMLISTDEIGKHKATTVQTMNKEGILKFQEFRDKQKKQGQENLDKINKSLEALEGGVDYEKLAEKITAVGKVLGQIVSEKSFKNNKPLKQEIAKFNMFVQQLEKKGGLRKQKEFVEKGIKKIEEDEAKMNKALKE